MSSFFLFFLLFVVVDGTQALTNICGCSPNPSCHHPQHPTSLREPRASHICSPSIIAPCPPARLRLLEKQPVGRGSICNQTEREQCEISGRGSFSPTLPSAPPPTRIAVGRGSDDEGACLRHSAPPTGALMQAACKHTPHMYLSAGGGGAGRGGEG